MPQIIADPVYIKDLGRKILRIFSACEISQKTKYNNRSLEAE
jgi:hypothetical protein